MFLRYLTSHSLPAISKKKANPRTTSQRVVRLFDTLYVIVEAWASLKARSDTQADKDGMARRSLLNSFLFANNSVSFADLGIDRKTWNIHSYIGLRARCLVLWPPRRCSHGQAQSRIYATTKEHVID